MKRVIFKHVHSDLPGETQIYTEVLIDGSELFERQKVVDTLKSSVNQIRYKILGRKINPSVAGYALIDLIRTAGLDQKIDFGTSLKMSIETDRTGRGNMHNPKNERLELVEPLLSVFNDHPSHHWSPAMTSKIAEMAGLTNWNTPADSKEAA